MRIAAITAEMIRVPEMYRYNYVLILNSTLPLERAGNCLIDDRIMVYDQITYICRLCTSACPVHEKFQFLRQSRRLTLW